MPPACATAYGLLLPMQRRGDRPSRLTEPMRRRLRDWLVIAIERELDSNRSDTIQRQEAAIVLTA